MVINDNKEIGSVERRLCPACGKSGDVVHKNIRDRLFSAPGVWNFRSCDNPECRHMWLDPTPRRDDLSKAYICYYTHQASTNVRGNKGLKWLYKAVKEGYLWRKFRQGECGPGVSLLGALLYLFPVRRNAVDAEARLLRTVVGGELLDVGCGDGRWLKAMQNVGWNTRGVDFDAKAVSVARSIGLDVQCGDLEGQRYADAEFDAITLNHVIEHIPDPEKALSECHRVLKPGGHLVIFTPNASSLSHLVFGDAWRGLEPPRHLQVFSPPSLKRMLNTAGFEKLRFHAQISKSVICESVFLTMNRSWALGSPSRIGEWIAEGSATVFNLAECLLVTVDPNLSDCIGVVATKS